MIGGNRVECVFSDETVVKVGRNYGIENKLRRHALDSPKS